MLYNLNQYGEGEMPTHALHRYARLGLPALPRWRVPTLTCRPVCWPTAPLRQRPPAPICGSGWS